ncbi:aspartic proteinase Asp1 isoform X2 [Triticum aestivum]|nr:aspartic proteinase Asp1-like isoform X2 [Triticum aestivum]XP_044368780.1 aspartic proteinase Asp1-like isoform X2 [Triticum aestivum]XP_044368781.1 aspartic proteinase Asp1-like isoform X2 [Triticum aestivum]
MAAIWALVIIHLLLLLPLLRSSIVFELHGDVYPTGLFYVTMNIGEPAKPYNLDVNTGSPLTRLECDTPLQSTHKGPHEAYRPTPTNVVPCDDERCVAVHKDLGLAHDCTQNPDQCDYVLGCKDGESSLGVLLTDQFSLPTNNENRPNLAFGCGYDQEGGKEAGKSPVEADGVLGIGKGTGDLVSQLKQQGIIVDNIFGHCLGVHGGGFLFFGGDRVPSAGVTWVPMAQNVGSHYSPGAATLNLNVQLEYPVSMEPMTTMFDSGSTYTYVHKDTYGRLIAAVGVTLEGSSLTKVDDDALPECWEETEPIQSVDDVKNKFKPLELTFGHGANQATMEIPPENYIVVTKTGKVCLGILNGSQIGLDRLNLIGGNIMQNYIMMYDNERARIGWARALCDEMPGPEPLIGSRL